MVNIKCIDCGNTIRIDSPRDGQWVSCPACETDYEVSVKDGKVTLKESSYEGSDAGEL